MEMFPNWAGIHAGVDLALELELKEAGIEVVKRELFREVAGLVKTNVIGTLHGWTFIRDWRSWICNGPGIDVDSAEELYRTHGDVVRVDGAKDAPSPKDYFHGLGCGSYHVDAPDGLKALADTIRSIVDKSKGQSS